MKDHDRLLKMILAALFLSLAYVLPFLTGQIPSIGSMLCPLHIPIILCGFICGPFWGLAVGLTAPIIRSLTMGMPPFFPMAVCMAFELAAYGFVSGLLHRLFPRKKPYIYCSLTVSMIIGRFVWGIAMFVFSGIAGTPFTMTAFIAGAFTKAIPGIVVQVVLIPVLVMIIDSQKFMKIKE